MSRELSPDVAQALFAWYQTPLGRRVWSEVQQTVGALSEGLFGYHLVQLGDLGGEDEALTGCTVRQRHILGLPGMPQTPASTLVAAPEQLPIASDSVDALVLIHTLDIASDPYQVLREVDRVLIPEGRAIIVGFNPWSLWGVNRVLCGRRRSQPAPWCARFLSAYRVQDWLSVLGFDLEMARPVACRPPLRSMSVFNRLATLDRWGQRFVPLFCGLYALRTVKRVSKITPIGTYWKRARPTGRKVVEPSLRG